MVVVQVVVTEIGERDHREVSSDHPVLVERVARHLECDDGAS